MKLGKKIGTWMVIGIIGLALVPADSYARGRGHAYGRRGYQRPVVHTTVHRYPHTYFRPVLRSYPRPCPVRVYQPVVYQSVPVYTDPYWGVYFDSSGDVGFHAEW